MTKLFFQIEVVMDLTGKIISIMISMILSLSTLFFFAFYGIKLLIDDNDEAKLLFPFCVAAVLVFGVISFLLAIDLNSQISGHTFQVIRAR